MVDFFAWSSLDPSLHAPLRLERYRKVRADTELAGVNPLIGMPRVSFSYGIVYTAFELAPIRFVLLSSAVTTTADENASIGDHAFKVPWRVNAR